MKNKITNHNVSRETFENINELIDENSSNLKRYADLLYWWNQRINLVSRNISKNILFEHIYHSLLLSILSDFLNAKTIIDAGTGGGLPGIPLAICFPGKTFVLNDIVSKKVLAVKQMAKKLHLTNVETFSGSIHDLSIPSQSSFSIITKHAFKIDDLFNLTSALPWNTIMMLKGCHFSNELTQLRQSLTIDCHHIDKGTDNSFYKDKCILAIRR